jgi:hypothetical protein
MTFANRCRLHSVRSMVACQRRVEFPEAVEAFLAMPLGEAPGARDVASLATVSPR